MRFSAPLIALLATSTNALSLYGGAEKAIIAGDDDLDVPGENPLKFCEADRTKDHIIIDSVILTPNPPEAGKVLKIAASGDVKHEIEEGAYVNLSVKYGYIRLINTKADLCEEIKNVDLECPIKKGPIAIIKEVELPKEIPPGKYTVLADVYTKEGEHITCLTAAVTFGAKSALGNFNIDL
ncbi:Phosphatidylglycerol/phosphatidylinositol transfer protein [Rhypophila sp. PSN 637]